MRPGGAPAGVGAPGEPRRRRVRHIRLRVASDIAAAAAACCAGISAAPLRRISSASVSGGARCEWAHPASAGPTRCHNMINTAGSNTNRRQRQRRRSRRRRGLRRQSPPAVRDEPASARVRCAAHHPSSLSSRPISRLLFRQSAGAVCMAAAAAVEAT